MVLSSPVVTLLVALALVASCGTLMWGLLGFSQRMGRRAAFSFALGNALLFIATMLLTQRGATASYLAYPGADLVLLCGMTLIRFGIQQLADVPNTAREHVAVVLLAAVLAFSQPPDATAAIWSALIRSLGGTWIMLRAMRECAIGLRAEFSTATVAAIALPFGLLGGVMLLRALVAGVYDHSPAALYDAGMMLPAMWSQVVGLLLLNIAMVGLSLARLVARIQRLAEYDALTGVRNRRTIEAAIGAERERLKRSGQPFSLIVFDLDHFKQVNDRLGHIGGDAALKHAATTVNMALRELDALGRFGGEEFVVLLPMTDQLGAHDLAERLCRRLAATPLPWAGTLETLTASFGVAQAHAGDQTADATLQRADAALYRAKAQGRNCVVSAEAVAP